MQRVAHTSRELVTVIASEVGDVATLPDLDIIKEPDSAVDLLQQCDLFGVVGAVDGPCVFAEPGISKRLSLIEWNADLPWLLGRLGCTEAPRSTLASSSTELLSDTLFDRHFEHCPVEARRPTPWHIASTSKQGVELTQALHGGQVINHQAVTCLDLINHSQPTIAVDNDARDLTAQHFLNPARVVHLTQDGSPYAIRGSVRHALERIDQQAVERLIIGASVALECTSALDSRPEVSTEAPEHTLPNGLHLALQLCHAGAVIGLIRIAIDADQPAQGRAVKQRPIIELIEVHLSIADRIRVAPVEASSCSACPVSSGLQVACCCLRLPCSALQACCLFEVTSVNSSLCSQPIEARPVHQIRHQAVISASLRRVSDRARYELRHVSLTCILTQGSQSALEVGTLARGQRHMLPNGVILDNDASAAPRHNVCVILDDSALHLCRQAVEAIALNLLQQSGWVAVSKWRVSQTRCELFIAQAHHRNIITGCPSAQAVCLQVDELAQGGRLAL